MRAWCRCICEELRRQPITAASAFFGVIVAASGFYVTSSRLSDGATALKASNAYTIQKDARELLTRIYDSGHIKRLIDGHDAPNVNSLAGKDAFLMFNFYLSVYRQQVAGGLSDRFAASFARDFCGFQKTKPIEQMWDLMVAGGMLSGEHVNMKETWCAPKS